MESTSEDSATAATDAGRFASLVTSSFANTEAAVAKADAVLDAALRE